MLFRTIKQQPLAVGHWRSSEIQTKLNIKHNAQIKSAQPSNMTHKDKASDKTRSRRRIAAGSWTRGNKRKSRKKRLQRRGTATSPRTWKSLGIEIPVFADGPIVEPTRLPRVWKPAAIQLPVFQTTNGQKPIAKVNKKLTQLNARPWRTSLPIEGEI